MLDEPLNTTIDEVAQRMTDGTPGDGVAFRQRVIARIEAGNTPRAPRRPLFVIVALAAAIVIAIMVTRSAGPKGPALQPSRQIADRSAGPGGMAGPVAQTPQRLPAADAAHAAPDPVVRRSRASGPGVVKTTPALEPNTVASIAVAPLAVDTLTPESIRIEQLETIAPILVAPLDITDVPRRNQ